VRERVEPTLGFEPRTCCLRNSCADVRGRSSSRAEVIPPHVSSCIYLRIGRLLRIGERDAVLALARSVNQLTHDLAFGFGVSDQAMEYRLAHLGLLRAE
jgi:hypothetical protein